MWTLTVVEEETFQIIDGIFKVLSCKFRPQGNETIKLYLPCSVQFINGINNESVMNEIVRELTSIKHK